MSILHFLLPALFEDEKLLQKQQKSITRDIQERSLSLSINHLASLLKNGYTKLCSDDPHVRYPNYSDLFFTVTKISQLMRLLDIEYKELIDDYAICYDRDTETVSLKRLVTVKYL